MDMSVLTDWLRDKKGLFEKWVFLCFIGLFLGMPIGTTPPTICAIAAVSIWVFSGLFTRVRFFVKCTWFWPVVFLYILPWIGLLYSHDRLGFAIRYAMKTHYLLCCLALASISLKDFSTERLIKAFLFGLAVNAVVGIFQLVGLIPRVGGWCSGFGRGYSTLTAYLIVGILAASFYFSEAKEKGRKICYGVLALLYFIHLVILEGRTGYITFAVLSPMIVRSFFKPSNIFKTVLVCFFIIGIMFTSPFVRDRVSLSFSQLKYHMNADQEKAWGREYSTQQDRFYMWYGAFRIFINNPIFGVGTGGYATELKKLGKVGDPIVAHPHNDLLFMAVHYGVFGIIAYLWFFIEILKNGFQQRRKPVGYFLLSTAMVLFISGMFNGHLEDTGTLLLLASAAGLQSVFHAA